MAVGQPWKWSFLNTPFDRFSRHRRGKNFAIGQNSRDPRHSSDVFSRFERGRNARRIPFSRYTYVCIQLKAFPFSTNASSPCKADHAGGRPTTFWLMVCSESSSSQPFLHASRLDVLSRILSTRMYIFLPHYTDPPGEKSIPVVHFRRSYSFQGLRLYNPSNEDECLSVAFCHACASVCFNGSGRDEFPFLDKKHFQGI